MDTMKMFNKTHNLGCDFAVDITITTFKDILV
jgi:hypothetical protein